MRYIQDTDLRKNLHCICSVEELDNGFRRELSGDRDPLQVSIVKLANNQTVAPHRHVFPKVDSVLLQIAECWIIFEGVVEAELYDIQGQFLETVVLTKGMILVTFAGGHSLKCLASDTILIECKNGPYTPDVKELLS